MTKDQYITEVSAFTTWLAELAARPAALQNFCIDRRIAYPSLEAAFLAYDWSFSVRLPNHPAETSGHTFSESAGVLMQLRDGLANALKVGNDEAVRDGAIAVMKWGGVTAGNAKWLSTNTVGLRAEIKAAIEILSGEDDRAPGFDMALRRFNAGMTKVYSLTVPNFIIYDSRVAGALAWFVALWSKGAVVLDSLRFPCLPPKEAAAATYRKTRNPDPLVFPWIRNRSPLHAQWNLRASWLLSDVVSKIKKDAPTSAFALQSDPLRALEAGLFMWGYDLPESGHENEQSVAPSDRTDIQPAESNWNEGETRGGKAKEFNGDWITDETR